MSDNNRNQLFDTIIFMLNNNKHLPRNKIGAQNSGISSKAWKPASSTTCLSRSYIYLTRRIFPWAGEGENFHGTIMVKCIPSYAGSVEQPWNLKLLPNRQAVRNALYMLVSLHIQACKNLYVRNRLCYNYIAF